MLHEMAAGTWYCGDPGVQYDTTINRWHTCSNTARINASNPCSEYMFIDDTACNLASINLRKFAREGNRFDIDSFRRACAISSQLKRFWLITLAIRLPAIAENSHLFRPLGLGTRTSAAC